MTDLIHQIVEIVKGIIHVFDANLLGPITEIGKSIGILFVKLLELTIVVVKWIVAKV